MTEHAVLYTQCNYFSLRGPYKERCLVGHCHTHRNREL